MKTNAFFAALLCIAGGLCVSAEAAAPKPAPPPAKPLAAAVATSTTTMSERMKIDLLIKLVERSDLVFIRNGKEYNSKQAAEHLRDKLDYANKKVKPGQTITARDFIKLIASSSYLSKKPYLIREKTGKQMPSGEWLIKRLEELEKTGKFAYPPDPAPVKPATALPVSGEK